MQTSANSHAAGRPRRSPRPALKAEPPTDVNRGEYREQSGVTFAQYTEEWVRTCTSGRTAA